MCIKLPSVESLIYLQNDHYVQVLDNDRQIDVRSNHVFVELKGK